MREHAWVIGLADGIGWSGCEKGLGRKAKTFEWRRIRDSAINWQLFLGNIGICA